MCNKTCIDFTRANLKEEDARGAAVIEVGSLDVNGSVRPIIEALHPKSYIGVDIKMGPGVDQICDANDILDRFGRESFDLLVSTELLEHVRDWRRVISNFKQILKPGGLILLTTRSFGFHYHGYPFDFWRYEMTDAQILFQDFITENIEADPLEPGILIKARRPTTFCERDLSNYSLYSIIKGKRAQRINEVDILLFRIYHHIYPFLVKAVRALGWRWE